MFDEVQDDDDAPVSTIGKTPAELLTTYLYGEGSEALADIVRDSITPDSVKELMDVADELRGDGTPASGAIADAIQTLTLSQRVRLAFESALYDDGDPRVANGPAPDTVMVSGVALNVGFEPTRLEGQREIVRALAQEILKPGFYSPRGESFLELPFDKDGRQWGEHINADQFLCLAAALGFVEMDPKVSLCEALLLQFKI